MASFQSPRLVKQPSSSATTFNSPPTLGPTGHLHPSTSSKHSAASYHPKSSSQLGSRRSAFQPSSPSSHYRLPSASGPLLPPSASVAGPSRIPAEPFAPTLASDTLVNLTRLPLPPGAKVVWKRYCRSSRSSPPSSDPPSPSSASSLVPPPDHSTLAAPSPPTRHDLVQAASSLRRLAHLERSRSENKPPSPSWTSPASLPASQAAAANLLQGTLYQLEYARVHVVGPGSPSPPQDVKGKGREREEGDDLTLSDSPSRFPDVGADSRFRTSVKRRARDESVAESLRPSPGSTRGRPELCAIWTFTVELAGPPWDDVGSSVAIDRTSNATAEDLGKEPSLAGSVSPGLWGASPYPASDAMDTRSDDPGRDHNVAHPGCADADRFASDETLAILRKESSARLAELTASNSGRYALSDVYPRLGRQPNPFSTSQTLLASQELAEVHARFLHALRDKFADSLVWSRSEQQEQVPSSEGSDGNLDQSQDLDAGSGSPPRPGHHASTPSSLKSPAKEDSPATPRTAKGDPDYPSTPQQPLAALASNPPPIKGRSGPRTSSSHGSKPFPALPTRLRRAVRFADGIALLPLGEEGLGLLPIEDQDELIAYQVQQKDVLRLHVVTYLTPSDLVLQLVPAKGHLFTFPGPSWPIPPSSGVKVLIAPFCQEAEVISRLEGPLVDSVALNQSIAAVPKLPEASSSASLLQALKEELALFGVDLAKLEARGWLVCRPPGSKAGPHPTMADAEGSDRRRQGSTEDRRSLPAEAPNDPFLWPEALCFTCGVAQSHQEMRSGHSSVQRRQRGRSVSPTREEIGSPVNELVSRTLAFLEALNEPPGPTPEDVSEDPPADTGEGTSSSAGAAALASSPPSAAVSPPLVEPEPSSRPTSPEKLNEEEDTPSPVSEVSEKTAVASNDVVGPRPRAGQAGKAADTEHDGGDSSSMKPDLVVEDVDSAVKEDSGNEGVDLSSWDAFSAFDGSGNGNGDFNKAEGGGDGVPEATEARRGSGYGMFDTGMGMVTEDDFSFFDDASFDLSAAMGLGADPVDVTMKDANRAHADDADGSGKPSPSMQEMNLGELDDFFGNDNAEADAGVKAPPDDMALDDTSVAGPYASATEPAAQLPAVSDYQKSAHYSGTTIDPPSLPGFTPSSITASSPALGGHVAKTPATPFSPYEELAEGSIMIEGDGGLGHFYHFQHGGGQERHHDGGGALEGSMEHQEPGLEGGADVEFPSLDRERQAAKLQASFIPSAFMPLSPRRQIQVRAQARDLSSKYDMLGKFGVPGSPRSRLPRGKGGNHTGAGQARVQRRRRRLSAVSSSSVGGAMNDLRNHRSRGLGRALSLAALRKMKISGTQSRVPFDDEISEIDTLDESGSEGSSTETGSDEDEAEMEDDVGTGVRSKLLRGALENVRTSTREGRYPPWKFDPLSEERSEQLTSALGSSPSTLKKAKATSADAPGGKGWDLSKINILIRWMAENPQMRTYYQKIAAKRQPRSATTVSALEVVDLLECLAGVVTIPTQQAGDGPRPIRGPSLSQLLNPRSKGPRDLARASVGAGTWDGVKILEQPQILVGCQGSVVKVAPTALRYWDKIALGPVSGKKDVVAFVLQRPTSQVWQEEISSWLGRVGSMFSLYGLGTHTAAQDTMLTLEDGEDIGLAGVIDKLSRSADPEIWHDTLRSICERISGAIQNPDQHVVLYALQAYDPAHASSRSLRGLLRLEEELQTHLAARIGPRSGQFVLRVVPAQMVSQSATAPLGGTKRTELDLRRFAFSVFDQLERVILRRPTKLIHPEVDKPQHARIQYPSFTLWPERQEKKAIEFEIKWPPPCVNMLERGMLLHVAYDYDAEMNHKYEETRSTIFVSCMDERAQSHTVLAIRPSTSIRENLREVWNFASQQASRACVGWRIVICKSGSMSAEEVRAWSELAAEGAFTTSYQGTALDVTIACATRDSSLAVMPCSGGKPPKAEWLSGPPPAFAKSSIYLDASCTSFALFPKDRFAIDSQHDPDSLKVPPLSLRTAFIVRLPRYTDLSVPSASDPLLDRIASSLDARTCQEGDRPGGSSKSRPPASPSPPRIVSATNPPPSASRCVYETRSTSSGPSHVLTLHLLQLYNTKNSKVVDVSPRNAKPTSASSAATAPWSNQVSTNKTAIPTSSHPGRLSSSSPSSNPDSPLPSNLSNHVGLPQSNLGRDEPLHLEEEEEEICSTLETHLEEIVKNFDQLRLVGSERFSLTGEAAHLPWHLGSLVDMRRITEVWMEIMEEEERGRTR